MRSAADGGLGALRMVDGWSVNDSWFSPGEGPFTVAAKLAMANVATTRWLLRQLGLTNNQTLTQSRQGRSLLDTRWLHKYDRAPGLVALLSPRGLTSMTRLWCRAVADDQALRFCPTCLAQGYQSVLCQLDGLRCCPVHGDRLVDRCPGCDAPTPPYAITGDTFDQPMICRSCGKPYAPIWGPALCAGRVWKAVDSEAGYVRLGAWVAQLDEIQVQWPDQAQWLGDPRAFQPMVQHHKRAAVGGVLAELHPAPVPIGVGAMRVTTFTVNKDARLKERAHGTARALVEQGDDRNTSRRAIYKCIRRRYGRAIGLPPGTLIPDKHAQLVWSDDFGVVMPHSAKVNPVLHGVHAWRLRFEEDLGDDKSPAALKFRSSLTAWSTEWLDSDQAWGRFVLDCLHLEIATARALNKAMGGLRFESSADRPKWLELMGLWYHRFNPKVRIAPDGLTVLKRPASATRPACLKIIAAVPAVCAYGC